MINGGIVLPGMQYHRQVVGERIVEEQYRIDAYPKIGTGW